MGPYGFSLVFEGPAMRPSEASPSKASEAAEEAAPARGRLYGRFLTAQPLEAHERRRVGAVQDARAWDEVGAMVNDDEDNGGGGGYPEALVGDASRLDAGGRTNPITLPMLAQGLKQVRRVPLPFGQMSRRPLGYIFLSSSNF